MEIKHGILCLNSCRVQSSKGKYFNSVCETLQLLMYGKPCLIVIITQKSATKRTELVESAAETFANPPKSDDSFFDFENAASRAVT